jgi:hypothetical protein
MFIYVKCLTYGYQGKDHLMSVKPTDTLMSFKDRIISLFKVGKNINIFDDNTEEIIDSYDNDEDKNIVDYFKKDSFYSVSFCEF